MVKHLGINNTGGNTWTATYSPQALHNVGPMVYSLTYEDLAGNSGSSHTNSSTGIAHYETNDLRHYMWKQNPVLVQNPEVLLVILI